MDSDVLTKEFQTVYETFNLDQSTFKLTQELTNKCVIKDKILTPRLALWLASKQQQIQAIDGSIVYGSGITLNQIINDCQIRGITNIDNILETAIQMVTELKIDQNCSKQLSNYKTQNNILTMFYSKIESILTNLGDQAHIIKNISWLLFIIMRKQLNQTDLVQSTCVLVALLFTIITQLNLRSENGDQLINTLISQFKIKDIDLFQRIQNQCKSYYSELIKQNIIKQLKTTNGYSLFVNSIVNSNQYKLDQFYKKLIKQDEFDERLVMLERQKNLTPKKITPTIKTINNIKQLAMQAKQEQQRDQAQPQCRYQKLLNYEIDSKITLNTNLREIRLPKNILMSPYAQQSIVATPMTEAMEMYNWIHDKQQQFKKYTKGLEISINQIPQQLISGIHVGQYSLIDNTFKEMIKFCEDCQIIETNISKTNQYWTLYILLLNKQKNDSLNIQQLKSLLSFCIECVHFILNKQSQILDQLILQCEIQHYQIWKQLDFFLNDFDNDPQHKIPHQLKEHFLDLEVKFISYYVWSSDSQSELMKFLNEIQINRYQQSNIAMNRLFNRVLHYCAFQIQTIGNQMKLNEQTQEYVWVAVKYLISEKTDHFRHHSLDQIVLASIYAILKLVGSQTKFQQIINAYEITNIWLSKQFIKKIVCNVYINNDCMGDIVSYYNQSFIPQIKSFMLQMQNEIKQQHQLQSPIQNKNPALGNRVLDSPLRDILPRQQQFGLMTPSTQLLYAYQESPLLKVKDPKLLLQQKENSFNQMNVQQKIDYSQETQDFILKKFEQLKTNKNKQVNTKTSFSILQQGTPRIVNTSRANSQMNSQQSDNSTFCKLLNFEQ